MDLIMNLLLKKKNQKFSKKAQGNFQWIIDEGHNRTQSEKNANISKTVSKWIKNRIIIIINKMKILKLGKWTISSQWNKNRHSSTENEGGAKPQKI